MSNALLNPEVPKGFLPVNVPPFPDHICPHFDRIASTAMSFFGITADQLRLVEGFCGNYHEAGYTNDGSGEEVQFCFCLRVATALKTAICDMQDNLDHVSKRDVKNLTISVQISARPGIHDNNKGGADLLIDSVMRGERCFENLEKAHPNLTLTRPELLEIAKKVVMSFSADFLSDGVHGRVHVNKKFCPIAPYYG